MNKVRGVGEPPGLRRNLHKIYSLQSEGTRASSAIPEPEVLYSPGPGEKFDLANGADRAGQKTLDEAFVAIAVQLGLMDAKPGQGVKPGPAGVAKKLLSIRHRVREVLQADFRQDRLSGARP